MRNGLHHQHVRKRIYRHLEPFPHPNLTKRVLDRVIFVIGALGPAATIPQVYVIYAKHDASGVSASSWFLYVLFSIVWLLYGIAHRERALIFANVLWIIVDGLVALGAVLY